MKARGAKRIRYRMQGKAFKFQYLSLVMVLELRVKDFIRRNPDIYKIDGKYSCKKSPYKVNLPLKESPELLQFLGILHGDGNMSMKRILITEKDDKFAKEICSLFKKIFTIAPNIFNDKRRNSNYCHIKNSIIYRFLIEVLEVPKDNVRNQLKLPTYIEKLNSKLKKEYVGGLYDAEGWLTKRQAHIGISITNREIIEFISKILSECKLKHSKTIRNRRRHNEFEIHIYGKNNLKIFQEKISFTHPKKIQNISTSY